MKTALLSISLLFVSVFGFSQHVYQFNNTLTGSGPVLTEVLWTPASTPSGLCGPDGIIGADSTETITTSLGSTGGVKHVFEFRENAGLSYNNAAGLGIQGTYTIHILCRKTDFTLGNVSFQRVIDFSNGTNDNGLYTNANTGVGVTPWPRFSNVFNAAVAAVTNFGSALVNNQYYLITLVRDGGTKDMTFYIDGASALTYNDINDIYLSSGTDPIIFFRDEISGGVGQYHCESGAGAVRYISISNAVSDNAAVLAAWNSINSVILPVNLTAFNAQKNGNSGLLQWQTATEINAAYYNVERSYDGINFTAISKVNAKGQAANTYSFNDAAGLSSTNTYYRLKIVDNNGNYKYSSVVRLANGQGIKVSVFPNPASEVVTVSGLKANDNIKLLSIDGKLLLQQNASGAQSMILNIAKYKPGTYILQVKNEAEVSQQKIVKY